MKTLHFMAYVPKLDITLDGITIYSSGLIGLNDGDFQDQLPEDFKLEDGEIRDCRENKDDLVMSVMEGDEWIFLEENQFELKVSVNGSKYEPFKLIK